MPELRRRTGAGGWRSSAGFGSRTGWGRETRIHVVAPLAGWSADVSVGTEVGRARLHRRVHLGDNALGSGFYGRPLV